MNFNSIPYLFVFLPLVSFGFWVLSLTGIRKLSLFWLLLASFVYYGLGILTAEGLGERWLAQLVPSLPDEPDLFFFAQAAINGIHEAVTILVASESLLRNGFIWLISIFLMNGFLGWWLRHTPSRVLLGIGIALNFCLFGAYKFNLHPLYFLHLLLLFVGLVMVWNWLAAGRLFRFAGFLGLSSAGLSFWGILAVMSVVWAKIQETSFAYYDPLGLITPLAAGMQTVDGASEFNRWHFLVLSGLLLLPLLLGLATRQAGLSFWRFLGRFVVLGVMMMVLALSMLASLYGFSFAAPIHVQIDAYQLTVGVPVMPLLTDMLMPLGLSFMILQHTGFLIDCWAGRVKEINPLGFGLFSLFYVQIPAGPILKWSEMAPQFRKSFLAPNHLANLRIGLALLIVGLFKKVMLADPIGIMLVEPLFTAAAQGQTLSLFEAWVAAISFLLQLYFDLSAYADMAIGAARMVDLRLPANFNAPLRAASVLDFWRCWHITLSRWFFERVQAPLADLSPNRDWSAVTLLLTMLVMALWHELSWSLLLWGGMHGVLLIVNYSWVRIKLWLGLRKEIKFFLYRAPMVLVTFLAISFAFVPFRAADFDTALLILYSMIGQSSWILPEAVWVFGDHIMWETLGAAGFLIGPLKGVDLNGFLFLTFLLIIVWFFPSSTELLRIANGLVSKRMKPTQEIEN